MIEDRVDEWGGGCFRGGLGIGGRGEIYLHKGRTIVILSPEHEAVVVAQGRDLRASILFPLCH